MALALGDWRISNNDSFYWEGARFEEGLVTSNKPCCMQSTSCPANGEQTGCIAMVSSPFPVTFCHLLATAQIAAQFLERTPVPLRRLGNNRAEKGSPSAQKP